MATVFRKLNLKDQLEIHVLRAPASFEPELARLTGVRVVRDTRGTRPIEFILAFGTKQKQVDQVAKVDQVFTLTGGFDGCLLLLDRPAWEEVSSRLGQRPIGGRAERALRRRFLGHAEEGVSPDRSSRISIPKTLRQYAGIEEGGEAVLMGMGRSLEIWAPDRLAKVLAEGDPDEESIFESLMVGTAAGEGNPAGGSAT